MARNTALLTLLVALLATSSCSREEYSAAVDAQGEDARAPQWNGHEELAQTGIDPPGEAASAQARQATGAQIADVAASGSIAAGGAGFDPASVPQTPVDLPPFPFFKAPKGLQSALGDRPRQVSFDGQYFIAGITPVLVQGRIFHDEFNLNNAGRNYSQREFLRNYEDAIIAMGGHRISTAQYTAASIAVAGGRDKLEKNSYGAPVVPRHPHDAYLIRTPDKEYWIDVSTGMSPTRGFLVVLERKVME